MFDEKSLEILAKNNINYGVGEGVILKIPNNPYVSEIINTSLIKPNENFLQLESNDINKTYQILINELEGFLQQQINLEQKIISGGFLPQNETLDSYLSKMSGFSSGSLVGNINNIDKNKLNRKLNKGKKAAENTPEVFKKVKNTIRESANRYTQQMSNLIEAIRQINLIPNLSQEAKEQLLNEADTTLYDLKTRMRMLNNFESEFVRHGGSTETRGKYIFSTEKTSEEDIDLRSFESVRTFLDSYAKYTKETNKRYYSHITVGKDSAATKDLLTAQYQALEDIRKAKGRQAADAAKQLFRDLQNNVNFEIENSNIILHFDKDAYVPLSSSQMGFGSEAILEMATHLQFDGQIEPIPIYDAVTPEDIIKALVNGATMITTRTALVGEYKYLKDGKKISPKEYKDAGEKFAKWSRQIGAIKAEIENIESDLQKCQDSLKSQELKVKKEQLAKYEEKQKEEVSSAKKENFKVIEKVRLNPSAKDKIDNTFVLVNDKGEKIILAFSEKLKEGQFFSNIEFNSGSLMSNLDLIKDIENKEQLLEVMLNLSRASYGYNPSKQQEVEEYVEKMLIGNFMRFMFNDKGYQEYLTKMKSQAYDLTQPNIFYVFRASGFSSPASRIIMPIIKAIKQKMSNKNVYSDIIKADLQYSNLGAGTLWGQVKEDYKKEENRAACWSYVASAVAATTSINMEIDIALLNALYSF